MLNQHIESASHRILLIALDVSEYSKTQEYNYESNYKEDN